MERVIFQKAWTQPLFNPTEYIRHHAQYIGDLYNLQQITRQETVIPQVIRDTNEDQHGSSRRSEETDSVKMTRCILNVHLPGGIIT